MRKEMASFVCSTFRRPELLENAIACFLAQEWEGDKLMVIVNDEPEQQLVFDHPEVRIFNHKNRIPLAIKRNIAVSECIGETDYLFHSDDDDLYAPERIRVSVENMTEGVFKTDRFCIDTTPIQQVFGRNIGNYAFTPRLWARYGGYLYEPGWPIDDMKLINHFDYYLVSKGLRCPQPKLPFMLYRKNIEGYVNLSEHKLNGQNREVKRGRVELSPKANIDWSFRETLGTPVPIHTVDPTYSEKVDLTRFKQGIQR